MSLERPSGPVWFTTLEPPNNAAKIRCIASFDDGQVVPGKQPLWLILLSGLIGPWSWLLIGFVLVWWVWPRPISKETKGTIEQQRQQDHNGQQNRGQPERTVRGADAGEREEYEKKEKERPLELQQDEPQPPVESSAKGHGLPPLSPKRFGAITCVATCHGWMMRDWAFYIDLRADLYDEVGGHEPSRYGHCQNPGPVVGFELIGQLVRDKEGMERDHGRRNPEVRLASAFSAVAITQGELDSSNY